MAKTKDKNTRLAVGKTYKIYIDGKFPRTESGRYYPLKNKDEIIANVCLGSRKDTREAVVAARKAFAGWSGTRAYLRGQILYRIAEMLEGRSEQFVAELVKQGLTKAKARTEVAASIDRLVYYAGWTDKFQQVFSSVNPVSSAHFNFTVPEPTGVVTIIAPEKSGLLGLVSNIAAAIAGGNTCVALASHSMLETRPSEQFVAELVKQGLTKAKARTEVAASIDRLVYYAGWTDKFQQVFSSVNPVSSAHFNFTVPEPTGVVTIIAPEKSGLLGLVSNIAAAIAGGNTCVALASHSMPLSAISFTEVLHAADVPAGVVNVLTGSREELTEQFAAHMDVNAIVYCDGDADTDRKIQLHAANNIKRVVRRTDIDWSTEKAQGPYFIRDTQEFKTTWHPIGG